jgi:hypothetical protein
MDIECAHKTCMPVIPATVYSKQGHNSRIEVMSEIQGA